MIPRLSSDLWTIILSHGGNLSLARYVGADIYDVARLRIQTAYRLFSSKRVRLPRWQESTRVLVWRRVSQRWRAGTMRRWRFASLEIDDWVVELDSDSLHEQVYLNAHRYPHPLLLKL